MPRRPFWQVYLSRTAGIGASVVAVPDGNSALIMGNWEHGISEKGIEEQSI